MRHFPDLVTWGRLITKKPGLCWTGNHNFDVEECGIFEAEFSPGFTIVCHFSSFFTIFKNHLFSTVYIGMAYRQRQINSQ